MSQTDKAQQALNTAQQNLERWTAARDSAIAQREQQRAGVPTSPEELDEFAAASGRSDDKVRAAESGVRSAQQAVLEAHGAVLRAGLEDERKALVAAERARDAQARKRDALLAQLDELDSADYHVHTPDCHGGPDAATGYGLEYRPGKTATLEQTVTGHQATIAAMEYVLQHDALPMFGATSNLPAYVHAYLSSQRESGALPESERLRAAAVAEEATERDDETASGRPMFPRVRAVLAGRRSAGVLPG